LSKKFEETDSFFKEKIVESQKQKILDDYENKNDQITIIVDHREYRCDVVKKLTVKGALIEPQQLDVGDYVLSSRIAVERKNVDDFLESLIKGKLFQQLEKLRDAYPRPILIIEGEGLFTKRNINHNAITGCLISIIVDFGISILNSKNSLDTANLLYITAKREQMERNRSVGIRGEKTSLSQRDLQQFIIEGLPNVSSTLANRLLNHFGSVKDIINATQDELIEVNGIGKNIASSIIDIINAHYLQE
jgi:Fanconi anemia group M protein